MAFLLALLGASSSDSQACTTVNLCLDCSLPFDWCKCSATTTLTWRCNNPEGHNRSVTTGVNRGFTTGSVTQVYTEGDFQSSIPSAFQFPSAGAAASVGTSLGGRGLDLAWDAAVGHRGDVSFSQSSTISRGPFFVSRSAKLDIDKTGEELEKMLQDEEEKKAKK
eukprot:CAMPEP_0194782646 /NCGR_PEP_ID=MMETSP0323_2-20130528/78803_1 /TAXON_ID=2866 ORGANISM="Crypthecodinium cohnii, Strain Seligo" /NCGR_SAMPLE_ID=MMETSP0323_2 /ASSEMBLY_ACC=CAM_ASM_000346 /LENGTH=164 /DNA_ID=CAMNT_0039721477 /DNA_START=70 /DNA_END=564 /DNA_ORIENTATION=+